MRRTFFTTLCMLAAFLLVAQITPSPASLGLVKNSNTPVSLFTGTTSVSVPMFSATAKNGASVPVGISYNASGIKVSEIAGPAGLGWQLYAGGSITRVTRGVPDEFANMVSDPSSITHSKLDAILRGDQDSEKDLFYFNFPGGGGKFIFSGDLKRYANESVWCETLSGYSDFSACQQACDGEPDEEACRQSCAQWNMTRINCETILDYTNFESLPYSDLTFSCTFNGANTNNWTIETPDGVIYRFGAHELTRANSKLASATSYNPGTESQFISTWYLTSIEYPNLPASEAITFEYSNPIDLTTVTRESQAIATAPIGGSTRELSVQGVDQIDYRTIIGTRYLSKINFAKGSINFSYGTRRDLSSGRKLERVELKDKNDAVVSHYVLNHSYFDASTSFYRWGPLGAGCSGEECYRLKLKSVYKDQGLVRSFTYRNEEGYSGSGVNYYELPPRNSYYYDHWGYNNAGIDGTSTYQPYPRLFYSQVQDRTGVYYNLNEGMYRESNSYATANLLTRVHYPTGGYTKFTYQNHSPVVGGVRIYRVENYNESDVRISGKQYNYESIIRAPTPSYLMLYAGGNPDQFIVYERSKANVLDLNGSPVGYGKVTVSDLQNQGKVEHYFKTDYRIPETTPTKGQYHVWDNGNLSNLGAISDVNKAPYSTRSLLFYDRGQPDSTKTYDDQNNLISKRIFTYEPHDVAYDYRSENLAIEVKRDFSDGTIVYTSAYDIEVRTNRLSSVVDTFYDAGGSISTTTDYTYLSSLKSYADTVTNTKSDGYASRSIMSYTGGVPSQTETQVKLPGYDDFMTTGVSRQEFRSQSGIARLLDKTYALELSEPVDNWNINDLIVTSEMLTYRSDGLLTKQRGLDGIVTGYDYDADGYMTKSIVNPDQPAYRRETIYDYKPLVGVEQVTDVNNRSVSYEYDHRNRLYLTRNNEGNIVSRQEYIADADRELSAELVVEFSSSGPLEDVPHSFYVTNINCPKGTCTYSWDWGDGTTSGNFLERTHVFNSPGTYTVAVTISNSEFPSIVLSKTLTINLNPNSGGGGSGGGEDDWSVDAVITGPNTIDYQDTGAKNFSIGVTAGDHGCANPNITYTWRYGLEDVDWTTHASTGPSASIALSGGSVYAPGDRYLVEVTVQDGCSGSGSSYRRTKVVTITGTGGAY